MPSKRSSASTAELAGVSAAVSVTGAGSGWLAATRTIRRGTSSVIGRAPRSSLGATSMTAPSTHTALPGIASSGGWPVSVATKIASDVDGSPSPAGICRKNPGCAPPVRRAVTTPDRARSAPIHGDRAPLPWTWAMLSVGRHGAGGGGGGGGGGAAQTSTGDACERGAGEPGAKSARLSSVSTQPSPARCRLTSYHEPCAAPFAPSKKSALP
jgi:hypothetical protein